MTEEEQNTVRVGPFEISTLDRDRLRSIADLNERTFAAEVRIALRRHMTYMEDKLSADG